jgi:hypothetical protein
MKKIIILVSLMLAAGSAFAVLISGGNGAVNTTAPVDDPGWSNVGSIRAGKPGKEGSRASAVYLGDKWFITDYHVYDLDGPTGVVVGAVCYTVDSNSWTRLHNTKPPYNGADTDQVLFQVKERPVLQPLRIRSTAISSGANVIMTGNGYDRQTSLVYWDASWHVTNATSGVSSGYLWNTASMILRWGTNRVSSAAAYRGDYGYGNVRAFLTTFDSNGGSNECQAAPYDSGGGVFYKNGNNWELAGLILTVDNPAGNAAVYGTYSYMSDISDFRDQITNKLVNFDSDIDGLPDWWESKYTNSATAMSAAGDSDGDGFSNLKEWEADTVPTNGASFFQNTGELTLDSQTFYFNGSTARQYQVFYTTNDLATTNLVWVAAHTNKVWGAGTNTFITVTNTDDLAFYRLWVTLP